MVIEVLRIPFWSLKFQNNNVLIDHSALLINSKIAIKLPKYIILKLR